METSFFTFAGDAVFNEPLVHATVRSRFVVGVKALTIAFRFPRTESGVDVLGVLPPSFFISS